MLHLVVGYPSQEPYVYVKDNQLVGTYSELVISKFYFLFEKFNITIVPLGRSPLSTCDSNGTCTGSLLDLQTGYIETTTVMTQSQFSLLPVNITLGPIMGEDFCHLIHTPQVETTIRSGSFLDFDERFDFPVLISSLMSIIFVASLQTGLIRSIHFNPIDSFEDVLGHNLIPASVSTLNCRYPIENSITPPLIKIRSRLKVIPVSIKSSAEIFETLLDSKYVMIGPRRFGERLKGVFCLFENSDHNAFYISENSVFQLRLLFVLNSNTNSETSRDVIKYAYYSFETGNHDNQMLKRIDFKCYGHGDYSGHCIQSKFIEDHIILIPLAFNYFDELLMVYFSVSLIAAVLLVIEICIVSRSK